MRNAKDFNRSFLIALFVVSFGLNWIWEMAQMPAYVETERRSWRETSQECAAFSAADAAVILAIYAVGIRVVRRTRSIKGLKFYLVVSPLGAIAAGLIEFIASALAYWTYSESMPIVFGLGLLPILHLATLAPVSVWLTRRWRR